MTIKNIITKKNILIFFIVAWVVFSVGYVALDQWQEFKVRYSQSFYRQGVSDSVKTLITQVEKCVAVPLFDGDKKVEVVSVGCLNKGNQNSKSVGNK